MIGDMDERGQCDDCRKVIRMADAYAYARIGSVPVYGRIGYPSSEISGYTRGVLVYRCGECLRELGPIVVS